MTKASTEASQAVANAAELRAEIAEIERAIDAGAYRPGPWARLLTRARAASPADRSAISANVSSVSRKLHLRRARNTIRPQIGVIIEIAGVGLGDFLLALGVYESSNVAAIAGMALWVTALQPLVKVMTGTILGVGYDYAYLAHGEPRFKMEYGSYLAQPRWARIALHLSGAIGSPLGAYLAAMLVGDRLAVSYWVAIIVFWMVNVINLVLLLAGIAGIKRLGVSPTIDTSCGAAGAEIREALGR
ncbi:MAG: hypothetical protein WCE23_04630 [Candidatus Binatus sp.]|jgi:hypothetical protein|uniref:hypothetical protein n=1 Tax=Candidatus Binatus sp. TaxID=2811406 RepID=UPI003C760A4C